MLPRRKKRGGVAPSFMQVNNEIRKNKLTNEQRKQTSLLTLGAVAASLLAIKFAKYS